MADEELDPSQTEAADEELFAEMDTEFPDADTFMLFMAGPEEEEVPGAAPDAHPDIHQPGPEQWAFLAMSLGSGKWKEQACVGGSVVDYIDGRTCTVIGDRTACIMPDGTLPANGQQGIMLVYEQPNHDEYVFFPFSAGGVFAVTLAQDGGGSSDDATPGTPPTWTYTVKNADTGATLVKNAAGDSATTMAPDVRILNHACNAATQGLAYRLATGVLHLLFAFEDDLTDSCPDTTTLPVGTF